MLFKNSMGLFTKKMIKISLSFVCLMSLVSCGNEGSMEGIIEGVPFRMEVQDVVAVRGYYTSTSYYNGYYSLTPNPMTIIMGGSEDLKTGVFLNKLTFYIYDMNQIVPNYSYAVPSNNIYAEFEYQYNGQTILVEARETSYIHFLETGSYEGQEVSLEFFLVFDYGSLYGSLATDVGLQSF